MISITGKLFNIVTGENIDRENGSITVTHTAEILHTVRGKTEIANLKLDASIVDAWAKAIGQDIIAEVRFWAMKTREGGIQSGLTLPDKKALPVVLAPAKPLAKAA